MIIYNHKIDNFYPVNLDMLFNFGNINHKKLYNMIKKYFFLYIIALLSLMTLDVNAQTWVIYDGSVLPTQATPVWSEGDVGSPAATYSIVDDAVNTDNKLLYETTTASGDKKSYKLKQSKPKNATWMFRLKAGNNTNSTEFEFHGLDGTTAYRINFKLYNHAKGGYVQLNYSTPASAMYPSDSSLNVKEWHTYRLTVENGQNFKIYIDENPTPVITCTGASSTQSHWLRFGDIGNTFTEGYIDWMAWDSLAAYAPGSILPQGVIIDGAISRNAKLSDLKVNNETISGFNPDTLTYNIVLPSGTTTIPSVTATTADSKATKVITDATSLPGTSIVEVTAEDNTTKITYTINFTLAISTNANLSDLLINGASITGFNPDTLIYNIVLPSGTTTIPSVTATTADSKATKVITDATNLPGTATIEITAEDGTTKKTYTINFTVAPATDATLSGIKVGTTAVTGFNKNVYKYGFELPFGSTTVPTVTATTTDPNANAVVTQPVSVNDSAVVLVTAADGVTTLTYKVGFTVAKNNDATLSLITVSIGELSPAFDKNVTSYSVLLPEGATTVPTITGTPTDANAKGVVTPATSLSGTTTITVTAEDGITTLTYSIKFIRSNNANLTSITATAGTLSPAFDANTLSYTLTLPAGTKDIPTIDGILSDQYATKVVTSATSLNGTTTITVTAEDGTTTKIYSVILVVLKSNNAKLVTLSSDNGTLTPAFNADSLNYIVVLPEGTTKVPVITATVADANASMKITNALTLNGTTLIEITAENGTKQIYSIKFKVLTSIDKSFITSVNITYLKVESLIRIKIDNELINSNIKIISITGSNVYNNTINSNNFIIDTNSFSKGLYIIQISKGDKLYTRKLIIN
jgi:hypothetical protein